MHFSKSITDYNLLKAFICHIKSSFTYGQTAHIAEHDEN